MNLTDLFGTLQTLLSTLYINDFNLYGRTYRVQAEAQAAFRQRPEDIGRLYVRGRDGDMVPVSALTRIEFRSGPTQMLRFNGFGSSLITGTPKPLPSSPKLTPGWLKRFLRWPASRSSSWADSSVQLNRASRPRWGAAVPISLHPS